jgi:hypothetical protein
MSIDLENKKICLIRQPSGLGDIIFCLKIAYHYKSLGYDIFWPVISDFKWISNYIEGINFYDKGDSNYNTPLRIKDKFYDLYNQTNPIFSENLIYLPLQFADRFHKNLKIMHSKYVMCNLEHYDWVDYFNPIRNIDKENVLFYEILGLKDGDIFCLNSRNYGSPPNYLKFNFDRKTDLKIVELDFIDGFNLFDWSKVIEKSSEIQTIDSSINYLIEKLPNNKKPIYLWSRRVGNWSEIDYIFNKDYNLMN